MNSRLASGFSRSWRVDQLQRARHRAHRVGVEGEIVLLRQPEDPDQVDRVVLEDVGRGEIDAVVVDDEIVAVGHPPPLGARPQPRHHAAQHRRRLGLLVFQLGAQDRGEIADVLGDQEVVLHEAFDILHAGMRGIAEPDRDLALHVERQPLLGAAGDEMHVAADRPQEIGAAAEGAVFLRVEHAAFDQFVGLAHAVDVFRDPEQRVQVAQAALAVLDVGLDQIARLPGAAVALLALGEFGGDEFGRGALHHFLVEARRPVRRRAAGRRSGTASRGSRCGSSCRRAPAGSIRRPSGWRGRPSVPCPTGNRGWPRRPARPRRSACRAG